ncbi:hypothetical protein B0A49_00817 [Cryomyces minteri]|uniref:NTF2-like domain-containing protein n=1 Tax=Cryomyces minteri TaxID=331657 RepID=A0A4U0XUN6_9PEZI|nr:hypothetical protein B0A49_00817 [Cryomyces minteri]
MHFAVSFFFVLLHSLATSANSNRDHEGENQHPINCLSDQTAHEILSRWIGLRSNDPTTPVYADIVEKTLANDITVEDETVNFFFFSPDFVGPYITNKTTYVTLQNVAFQTSQTASPSITQEVPLRHDCSSITFRWLYSATINKVVPGSTANIGDPVLYKGTDLLIVDAQTQLVQHVYTSADYIRETYQKGLKICYQKDAGQTPVCADSPAGA